jgi:hypothetical protein
MQARPYWLQSDRFFNVQFRRRWVEPAWVLAERPPRPPDKRRRPAPAQTGNRPLIKSLTSTDHSENTDRTEARHAAEALFAPDGAA